MVDIRAASMAASIAPRTPTGSSSAIPRTKESSRSAASAAPAAPGFHGKSTRSPTPIGSQSRLRTRIWVTLKTSVARTASASLRHAMVRCAR